MQCNQPRHMPWERQRERKRESGPSLTHQRSLQVVSTSSRCCVDATFSTLPFCLVYICSPVLLYISCTAERSCTCWLLVLASCPVCCSFAPHCHRPSVSQLLRSSKSVQVGSERQHNKQTTPLLITAIMADSAATRVLDYVVVGAGPAGLQAAHLLERAGRSFRVLEAAEKVAPFFREHPRHGKLISINKTFNSCQDADFALRHDWYDDICKGVVGWEKAREEPHRGKRVREQR